MLSYLVGSSLSGQKATMPTQEQHVGEAQAREGKIPHDQ